MLKTVCFFVLTLVVIITGYRGNLVLKNKLSGKVLGGEKGSFGGEEDWENGDWQLWKLEPGSDSEYSILRNVASGKVLMYPTNRSEYQLWDVSTKGDIWVQLNRHVLILNRTALYFTLRENDPRDRWHLVQQSQMPDVRYNITPRGLI